MDGSFSDIDTYDLYFEGKRWITGMPIKAWVFDSPEQLIKFILREANSWSELMLKKRRSK
jgi:hypothetical protein